jgi:NAD(P)-dependent dehydrogenase (short-subunit alcohol dehydrogenase family)
MPDDLQGKTALVTGARRGIGRATAELLAASGATVALLARQPADEAVDGIRAAGGRAFAIYADIGTAGAIDTLLAGLDEGFRAQGAPDASLDILVNNIGAVEFQTIGMATDEHFDWSWEVNARVPFLVTRALLPRLNDGGRIINISSAGTRIAPPETISYTMAKAAVENFTRVLAKELGPRGITVNAVSPGFTVGETTEAALTAPGTVAYVEANTLLGRLGRPEDVADAVVALASPDCRWVTGQLVEASGGLRF